MSLTCKILITLRDIPEEKMAAVQLALGPDNVDFPEGLSLHMEESGGSLLLRFESLNGMGSLIPTVDEVLEHVQVSLSVME